MRKSFGQCEFCQTKLSKMDSVSHFLKCDRRQSWFEHRHQKAVNDWFYLRAQGGPYWIDILISSAWTLADLDHLLRDCWLECCGHLSHFSIDSVIYERFQDPDWLTIGEELSPDMEVSLDSVLRAGASFSHVYDYGSSTELQLQVCEKLQFPLKKQMLLCSRNIAPTFRCFYCDEPASLICNYSEDYSCTNCATLHSCDVHESGENMLVPIVNSPRSGVCGYTGIDPGL